MSLGNSQLVCTHEPRCLCSNRDYDCDCRSLTAWPALTTLCTDCGQAMVLIDCDTGVVISQASS